MNHPHVKVVPRTTNQDDVENYFSLQRGRIPGGEATVQQYFEGNSTLATDLLVKAEKHDINNESFIGSYSAVVTPNYVSFPLKRKKSTNNGTQLKLFETKGDLKYAACSVNDKEVNVFHSQKDVQQLYRQVQQVFDYINVKSSSVLMGYGQRLVSILREEQNKEHLIRFLKIFNFKLRNEHFFNGNWKKETLMNARSALLNDQTIEQEWNRLLRKVNMLHVNETESSKSRIFKIVRDKFSKRRCVTFLAVDCLNPKCDEQQTAIRQLLRTFKRTADKGSTFLPLVKPSDKCYKCGDEGHWAHQGKKDIPHDPEWLKKQQCYKCGEHGHLKNDCKAAMKNKEIKKGMETMWRPNLITVPVIQLTYQTILS